FTNNIVRHAGSGIGMHGCDDLYPSQQSTRFLIRNNLFTDISIAIWGGDGWLFAAWKGVLNLTIDHNTGFMDQAVMMGGYTGEGTTCGGTPYPCGHDAFQYTNNLTVVGAYGFTGLGTNQGADTLTAYFPGAAFPNPTPAVFAGNVLAGPWQRGDPSLYPP